MGVRTIVPSSISFTVELRCSIERRYRVSVIAIATLLRTFLVVCFACCQKCPCPNLCGGSYTLDLQERYIFLSSGVIPNISDRIEDFVSQLSEIASDQLAFLKWDGTSDLTTEYQIVRVLPGYQAERSLAKFNIVGGNGSLIQGEELHHKITIQL